MEETLGVTAYICSKCNKLEFFIEEKEKASEDDRQGKTKVKRAFIQTLETG